MNVEYYRQRAGAALIVTEAAQISPQGQGYAWTPGIHSAAQVQGWKAISEAVHKEGGHIFLQLWHVGRVSHAQFQPGGQAPVAPSALAAPDKTFIVAEDGQGTWAHTTPPTALTHEGIAAVIADFVSATENAIKAGMDGVEIHAGNGYLFDQFINSNSNHRKDEYGGSVENRARLLLEVVDALVAKIGSKRVSVRLTPMGRYQGMGDNTPEATFGYIAQELSKRDLAYLHLVEPAIIGTERDAYTDPRWDAIIRQLRHDYQGVLMLAGGYTKETAEAALASGRADIIAFGRTFIANPDLPYRFRHGLPLNVPDTSSFFGGSEVGYIDYPLAMEALAG
jgi:N-ethylmaleimide reductase